MGYVWGSYHTIPRALFCLPKGGLYNIQRAPACPQKLGGLTVEDDVLTSAMPPRFRLTSGAPGTRSFGISIGMADSWAVRSPMRGQKHEVADVLKASTETCARDSLKPLKLLRLLRPTASPGIPNPLDFLDFPNPKPSNPIP